jgi:hypothetical protein
MPEGEVLIGLGVDVTLALIIFARVVADTQ